VGALADREMQRRLAAGAAGLRREAAGMRAEGAGLRQQLAELAGLVPMQLERVRAALGQTLQQKARPPRGPARAPAAAAAPPGGQQRMQPALGPVSRSGLSLVACRQRCAYMLMRLATRLNAWQSIQEGVEQPSVSLLLCTASARHAPAALLAAACRCSWHCNTLHA